MVDMLDVDMPKGFDEPLSHFQQDAKEDQERPANTFHPYPLSLDGRLASLGRTIPRGFIHCLFRLGRGLRFDL